jgi:pathogenesis-related protein 1
MAHPLPHRLARLGLVATLLSCGSGAGDEAPQRGEPVELAGIIAAHNVVRAGVGVGPVAWNDALAVTAATWAAQCVDLAAPIGLVDHNPGRSTGHPWYVGENIYASTGTASGTTAVTRWSAEVADYDYASNTCAAGKVCGHYTQVVWRASTQVGCARRDCPGLRYPSTIVCNYGPGGNSGGRPY